MNYKNAGFRAFYKKFCVLHLNRDTRTTLSRLPGINKANGLLTYGYYDRECGLTLEVLAGAHIKGSNITFDEPSKFTRLLLRIESVASLNFTFFADESGKLAEKYKDKLEVLNAYDVNEEIKRTREITELDTCRHSECIDDILVYIKKDNMNTEGCWVRLESSNESNTEFNGTLLNEPYQKFGCHKGDSITFKLDKHNGNMICYADFS